MENFLFVWLCKEYVYLKRKPDHYPAPQTQTVSTKSLVKESLKENFALMTIYR